MRELDTRYVMKKANRLRNCNGKLYRRAMNYAISDAYARFRELENRLGDPTAEVYESFLNYNDVDTMELDYLVKTQPEKVTPEYLVNFL